jgi:transcription elongation GreA/GreB family factor
MVPIAIGIINIYHTKSASPAGRQICVLMLFKQKIYVHCLKLLNNKIAELENILKELDASAASDTKSSAGDKHETARAMVQIEQENIGKQLGEILEQKNALEKIDPNNNSAQIIKGSLVKTNRGYLCLSVALGKITVDEKIVMVISPQSPLGIKLMGLKAKDTATINGVSYVVESVD